MIKKLAILCLVICITSCTNKYKKFVYYNSPVLKNLKQNDVVNEEKSIIITKINYNNLMKDSSYKEKWDLIGTGWINDNENFVNLIHIKESKDKFDVYSIKPGNNILVGIGNIAVVDRMDPIPTPFHYPLLALIENPKMDDTWISLDYLKHHPLSASFLINPNEIVYVGDVTINIYPRFSFLNDNISIKIEDNYDDAIKNFVKNYPQFKNKKIIKRLIKLGTIFNNEGKAVFFTSPLSIIRDFK